MQMTKAPAATLLNKVKTPKNEHYQTADRLTVCPIGTSAALPGTFFRSELIFFTAFPGDSKLAFRRTQNFGARLECSERQAMFLSCGFLS